MDSDYNQPNGIRENKICKFDDKKTYFSICPDWNGNQEYSCERKGNMSLVYLNKEKALAKLKKYKNARLRCFTNIDDALKFTYEGNMTDCSNYSQLSQNSDFNDNSKSGRIRFRKIIESGQINLVEYIVARYPKCLVASSDSPAILIKEGRQNALHIACKSLYTDISLFILQTISDLKFYKKLYPDNSGTYYTNMREVLLDGYINTPTVTTFETPLHLAAKNGCYDVVKMLVSFPQLKMTRNKWDQLPIDMICSNRHQNDFDLISKIMILLQKNYFVPVLRSADRCIQPMIGKPFLSHKLPSMKKDKFDPTMEIHAIAGPMSESDAFKFYETWKSPNNRGMCNLTVYGTFTTPKNIDFPNGIYSHGHLQTELYRSLRCSDYEKGLEVIGRSLARTLKIGWMEYWSFLGAFANLAEINGLRMLEGYFREKNYENQYRGKSFRAKQINTSNTVTSNLKNKDGTRGSNRRGGTRCNSSFTKVEDIEQMLNLRNSNEKFVPSIFLTNYVHFFSRRVYDTLINFGTGNNIILLKNFKKQSDLLNSAIECFVQFFDGNQFNLQLVHPEIGKEVASLFREENKRCDIKTRLFKTISANNLSFILSCKNIRQINVMPYMKCVIKNVLRNLMLMSYSDNSLPRAPLFEAVCHCRWSDSKNDRKVGKFNKYAGKSKLGSSNAGDGGLYFDSQDNTDNIFIFNDSKPSKMDYYVLMVLQDMEICSKTFPLVYKWRSSVLSYKMSAR